MANRYMAVRQEIKLAFIFDYEQNQPIDLRHQEMTEGDVKVSYFAERKENTIRKSIRSD
jgi:hypothetical protein